MYRSVIEADTVVASAYCDLGKPHMAEKMMCPGRGVDALSAGARGEWWALAGRVSRMRGRLGEGMTRLQRAVRYLEAQRCLIPGVGFRASSFSAHVGVYEDLISLMLETKPLPVRELFSVVESARGRAFTDWMNLSSSEREILTAERARLGRVTQRVNELELTGKQQDAAPFLREMESLERQISERVRRLDPQGDDAGAQGGGAVRGVPEHPLIVYFIVGDRVLGLVSRGDRMEARVLPCGITDVRTALRSMWLQFEEFSLAVPRESVRLDFMRRRTDRTLQALYDQLVKPLVDLLPDSGRLTVIPHRDLHNVPFECLYDGNAYVDERWIVTRATTSSSMSERAFSTALSLRAPLVFGALQSGPAFVRAEMDAVSARLGTPAARVLADATTASLLREMRDASLVHLSTHGYFREDNPVFSRLTTGDGALFVADLLGQDLSAELVVLAACNSGRVFAGRGDDLAGLAHAFLAAGAGQLVASRWRVHDEATLELVGHFYDGLSEGRDAADALASAGRRLRDSHDHPFFWGAFTVHTR